MCPGMYSGTWANSRCIWLLICCYIYIYVSKCMNNNTYELLNICISMRIHIYNHSIHIKYITFELLKVLVYYQYM